MEILTEENDPYALNAELIRCIWNVDVENMPYVKLHQYCKELEFLAKPYEPKAPKKEYDINGVIYRPILDLSKVTTAQYIDFQECTKRNAYKELLNCLFIKDGCEYGDCIDDYLWENMTLDVYSDVLFFFSRVVKEINDKYPQLFGKTDEEGSQEDKGQDSKDSNSEKDGGSQGDYFTSK